MPEIASVVWEDLGGPQTDLLQIWVQGVEPMARQTIKKPITSQGGLCLSRPIFGLNCKIRQTGALIVGELLLAVAVLQCSGQFTRLAGSKPVDCIRGQGPDTTLACLLLVARLRPLLLLRLGRWLAVLGRLARCISGHLMPLCSDFCGP